MANRTPLARYATRSTLPRIKQADWQRGASEKARMVATTLLSDHRVHPITVGRSLRPDGRGHRSRDESTYAMRRTHRKAYRSGKLKMDVAHVNLRERCFFAMKVARGKCPSRVRLSCADPSNLILLQYSMVSASGRGSAGGHP